MNILGLWDGHDAGAALLVGGRLIAAVNEERLTRRKLEIAFPAHSIDACLQIGNLQRTDINAVASCTTDVAKAIGRLIPSSKEAYYEVRRRKARPGWHAGLRSALKYRITEWGPNAASRRVNRWALRRILNAQGFQATLDLHDHHECHAATAAYASRFDSCLVVTIDGVGDGKSATVSHFRDGRLRLMASTPATCSPGVFFEHVTHLLNMRELEDEGKVMALADYASPVPDSENLLMPLLTARGLSFETPRAGHALSGPLKNVLWRFPNEQFAFMAQRALEGACIALISNALEQTGERRVALAGGVASNVKVNRRVRSLPRVDDVFVFPHMGDGGLAVGAAALTHVQRSGPPSLDLGDGLGLGLDFDSETVEATLRARHLAYRRCPDLPSRVADLLVSEKVVLWFQGRMEYGPRALGHRSLLARPDRPALRDRLNLVLKRRVWYQPFCPSILDSDARAALEDFTGQPNRHMTMAYVVAEDHRQSLAGVTNIDGSCRPQMVADAAPGPFADLLREMRRRIGIGAVLNTSFNIHGAPLVCSPEDAVEVFLESGADALAIEDFLVCRSDG